MNEPNDPQKPPDSDKPLTLWQVIGSVNAALFGVQSRKNRERDFTRGKPLHFIIVGVIMTLVLILTIVFIVKLILHNAGA